ncbi:MAG: peptidoglycan bridge formation glycyltransferase FemA/FemB family protein [Bacilli bacterium]|nr:peptidoglycan bridge formation glycyltransferase FemA/FemB family protein [Bacilli bacterium]
MKFKIITEKEYESFWEESPLKTFLSSPKIATLRKNNNWESFYLGVEDKKKLVAAVMLLSHKRRFNTYEFYSPRGPLLDYKNKELLDFFMSNIKSFIKDKNGYVYRIDPYIINKERDIDGHIVEGGEDNSEVISNLKELGFKQVPLKDTEQVVWMFSLNLEGKTEDEIYSNMKPNTRNTIRKAEKLGIEMKELDYDDLDEFMSIMKETSERKGFSIRDLSYYQTMYNLFVKSKEAKFYITKLNLKKYVDKLKVEREEKVQKKNELGPAKYNDGKRNSFDNEIKSLDKRIDEATTIMNEKKTDTINLSSSMFMLIKPETIYLTSGNYEEYMKFNGQYLIQWELIKYGIKNGYKKHNFYGIPANIDKHPEGYGIYEFKKGFNGQVEELIGEYEFPISWKYNLIKFIRKIKK